MDLFQQFCQFAFPSLNASSLKNINCNENIFQIINILERIYLKQAVIQPTFWVSEPQRYLMVLQKNLFFFPFLAAIVTPAVTEASEASAFSLRMEDFSRLWSPDILIWKHCLLFCFSKKASETSRLFHFSWPSALFQGLSKEKKGFQ